MSSHTIPDTELINALNWRYATRSSHAADLSEATWKTL